MSAGTFWTFIAAAILFVALSASATYNLMQASQNTQLASEIGRAINERLAAEAETNRLRERVTEWEAWGEQANDRYQRVSGQAEEWQTYAQRLEKCINDMGLLSVGRPEC